MTKIEDLDAVVAAIPTQLEGIGFTVHLTKQPTWRDGSIGGGPFDPIVYSWLYAVYFRPPSTADRSRSIVEALVEQTAHEAIGDVATVLSKFKVNDSNGPAQMYGEMALLFWLADPVAVPSTPKHP